MKVLLVLTLAVGTFLVTIATASARLGETAIQLIERYGAPKDTQGSKAMDKGSPLLEGAVHHVYESQGWKIRAAFLQLDGPAVRLEYSKLANGQSPFVKDYELQAIMAANTPPGMTWSKTTYNNPGLAGSPLSQAVAGAMMGERVWQRSDGALLWLRVNAIVRLELPAVRQYEAKLKVDKEQKARASVPQF